MTQNVDLYLISPFWVPQEENRFGISLEPLTNLLYVFYSSLWVHLRALVLDPLQSELFGDAILQAPGPLVRLIWQNAISQFRIQFGLCAYYPTKWSVPLLYKCDELWRQIFQTLNYGKLLWQKGW